MLQRMDARSSLHRAGSVGYFHRMLNREKAVLVLVDVQGKLAESMDDKQTLFANLERLVRGCQALRIPILWNEQNPEKLGPTIEAIRRHLADHKPLPKMCFSCCGNPDFLRALEATGRKQVLLAGIETHVCVYQTALGLLSQGYQVEVVADAVSSRTSENRQLGLEKMARAGAELTGTEMALFEMLERAEGPEFRQILQIVK